MPDYDELWDGLIKWINERVIYSGQAVDRIRALNMLEPVQLLRAKFEAMYERDGEG